MKTSSTHENKRKLHLPLNAYLSYLLVATLLFTGVSFSKFATSASVESSARVACVITTATGERLSADDVVDDLRVKNDSYQYQITVSNTEDGTTSEVAMQYTICIELPEGFPPMNITVTNVVKDEVNSTDTLLIYNAAETFSAGVSATKTHLITIWTTEETRGIYDDQQVVIYVKAEQID